jgi:hypothetical protein
MLLRKRLDGGLAPQVSPFIKSGFKSCTSSELKANKFRRFILRFKISSKGKIFNSNKVFEIKIPPKITKCFRYYRKKVIYRRNGYKLMFE